MLSFPGWQGVLAVIAVAFVVIVVIWFFAKKLE
jgi:hypothetical protein